MGIEYKLQVDKTDPLDVFPDFPKTWETMSDKQLEFYLKQLARYGRSEENMKAKINATGYTGDIVIEHNEKNQSFIIRLHGHNADWVQSSS